MNFRKWASVFGLVAFLSGSLAACGGNSGDACFVAGTRIDTPLGRIPIEQLRAGDRVLAYDSSRDAVVESVVTRLWVHEDRSYGTLLLPEGGTLQLTSNHPVYSATAREYVPAEDLVPGSELIRLEELGPKTSFRAASESLRRKFQPASGRATVYNIEVATHHNYFAEGVLVHNKSPDADPPAGSSIPPTIDELTIDLFGGTGFAADPWETTRFYMATQPLSYLYQLREPGSIVCSVEDTLSLDENAALRDRLAEIEYAGFQTDLVTADQPTRTIEFRDRQSTTTIYHLFATDWQTETFPDNEFFYATAGAEELTALASEMVTKCGPQL